MIVLAYLLLQCLILTILYTSGNDIITVVVAPLTTDDIPSIVQQVVSVV